MATHHNNVVTPQKDCWEKLKIVAWLLLSVSTLTWTIVSWFLLQMHEKKINDRQAQAVIEARELQRRVSAAQLAATLLPNLSGTESQRRKALLILAVVAPDIADRISTQIGQTAKMPDEKELAQAVSNASKEGRANLDFLQSLENARVYQRFQQYGQADREYLRAAEHTSSGFALDHRKIEEAKAAYSRDRFPEAARLFEEAFRAISIQ